MSRLKQEQKIRTDWWSKSIACCLLGLTLSFAIMGLFAWYGPGGIGAVNKDQFTMWMVPFIWLIIVAFGFLFKSGRSASLWLGAANLACWGLFALLRSAV